MPALLPDYEYDIFISYRHKDNKYDGWVTEFVTNLGKELEATLKENVSIYFDKNPTDGLLETYDVDKSLERKRKSLILIPILSQTYCDPKSFAWKNEFCAFNKMIDADPLGREIRLTSGNVVSRILPVKIHDLDSEDMKLLESETKSVLRSIDFIYREPGVNRPLRPQDDKNDNRNRTDYRNQINKIANAIKEILFSLKNHTTISYVNEITFADAASRGNPKSISVLPFVNLSADPEQEYISDGIADEIINSLVHLKDLKVAGRMSSMQFRGIKADSREVGEKFGVSNVLEGSVRKQGNRLRVTAQLMNVADGFYLWSEKYDRSIEDIFAIQDEIALAVTEKLKVTLLQNDRERIVKSHTQNTEAYDLFLKGRFYINRRGAFIMNGIAYYQKAIEADPTFALAHAGYADANLLIASYGLAPPRRVMDKVKESSERALQLDPRLCEPYCSLGYYYTAFERNWKEAEKYFQTSIELNPHYTMAHIWYGWNYLTWVEGNFEEAEKHGRMAIKIEPLNAVCYGACSLILHAAGKFQEALAVCKAGIELDPNSFLCQLNEGAIYFALHQFDESVASYESAIKISNRHHFAVNGLVWTYSAKGEVDKAHALFDELKKRSQTEYIGYTFTGLSAAYLHNLDEAFDFFDKADQEREPLLLTIKYEKWVPAELKNDVRYQKLLDKVGFPNPS